MCQEYRKLLVFFFLISYLVCSHNWLNHLMDNHHFSYTTKINNNKFILNFKSCKFLVEWHPKFRVQRSPLCVNLCAVLDHFGFLWKVQFRFGRTWVPHCAVAWAFAAAAHAEGRAVESGSGRRTERRLSICLFV
jgi:hypothetical protein